MKKQTTKFQTVKTKLRSDAYLYACMLPFMLIFFTFTLLPVLRAVYYSFNYFNILEPPQFIGLDNYRRLFLHDDVFIKAIINTFVFAVITGPFGYMASLLLAWLINEFSPKFRAVMILVFYAPSISGQLFLIWTLIFSCDSL